MKFGFLCTQKLLLLSIFLLFSGKSALSVDMYVSVDGNDAWNGQQAEVGASGVGPFATFAGARDAIRRMRADGALSEGVTVHIGPGTYLLDSPFALSAEDSGTVDAPIRYDAGKPGSARLLGGRVVSGFTRVSDVALLDRLDESAHEKVYSLNLKQLGINDFGKPSGGGLELFYDGKPMQIARWPNEGFVKIVTVTGGEAVEIHGRKGDRIGRWVYEDERPARWVNEKDGWLYGYWFWDWSADHEKIKSIDPEMRIIEVEEPYHGYGYAEGQWYYALNLLSELDAPGEWYLDRETGDLFFWPPGSIDDAEVFVSLLASAIVMEDVSRTTIRGLVIEGARDTAIRITGGENNRIVACTVRNSGADAIAISGGTEHGVVGCDIYNLAGGGITLQGGDRPTLTPSRHFVQNNHIHDYARWYRMYRPAVLVQGVGQRVAHNLIHDAPHMAIQFGGNDHVFEFNEIHSVCYESNDAGAIYAGRDWTERGTIIRNNFMHHVTGYEDRGCVGVYLDDMFCGTRVSGNVFYKVHWAAFIGGGRDNLFDNNLFVDCPKALHVDNRAQNWASYVVPTTMMERLNAMPYREAPWKDRFPELLTIVDDEPAAPKGNLIARNVFFGDNWDDIAEEPRPLVKLEGNIENLDPGFVNTAFREKPTPGATDFRLREDGAAMKAGFVTLELERMGLYESTDRATWPVQHHVRE